MQFSGTGQAVQIIISYSSFLNVFVLGGQKMKSIQILGDINISQLSTQYEGPEGVLKNAHVPDFFGIFG